jgi:hypothetical protein
MNENSFWWFKQQVDETKNHIRNDWPDWMKNTSNFATASFPTLGDETASSDKTVNEPSQKLPR